MEKVQWKGSESERRTQSGSELKSTYGKREYNKNISAQYHSASAISL